MISKPIIRSNMTIAQIIESFERQGITFEIVKNDSKVGIRPSGKIHQDDRQKLAGKGQEIQDYQWRKECRQAAKDRDEKILNKLLPNWERLDQAAIKQTIEKLSPDTSIEGQSIIGILSEQKLGKKRGVWYEMENI